jgi:hypothetical protein
MTKSTRYGLLTFVCEVEPNRFHVKPMRSGLFHCDCGNDRVIPLTRVRCGESRSCGCERRKTMRGLIRAHYAEFAARGRAK